MNASQPIVAGGHLRPYGTSFVVNEPVIVVGPKNFSHRFKIRVGRQRRILRTSCMQRKNSSALDYSSEVNVGGCTAEMAKTLSLNHWDNAWWSTPVVILKINKRQHCQKILIKILLFSLSMSPSSWIGSGNDLTLQLTFNSIFEKD